MKENGVDQGGWQMQSNQSVSIMQLVYVNNVHICENAILKKHTVEITDECHVAF